jgi:hypothetical protein
VSNKNIQKLTSLTASIASLKTKEQQLESALAGQMVAVFKESGAFAIDFDVLVGGMLEVVQKANNKTADKETWRRAGDLFRKRHARKLCAKKAIVQKVAEFAHETA